MVFALLALLAAAAPSLAQAARDGKLIVTVTDQTGAVLPGAIINVNGLDDANRLAQPLVAHADARGVATLENLLPGRYAMRVDMDGFQSAVVAEVRVRSGENKRTQPLDLKKLSDEVTVERDRQTVATDRSAVLGGALTREQIEALPEDPDELERALKELAGGDDAIIRVDSFEGGRLPDKSQIKAIHISRDQFAAENHSAFGFVIDIVTQAGSGPFRMNGSYNLRDSALDGKNPLIGAKGPARNQGANFGAGGTLIPQKLSVSVSGGVRRNFQTPMLYAVLADGTRVQRPASITSPNNGYNFYGDLTYALTKDQTLRVYYQENRNTARNLGVGGFSFLDRAYSNKSTFRSIRGQEAGPLGRRFVTNTKFALTWQTNEASSVSDDLTLIVNDAFTVGGAQRSGGRTTREFMVQSDLDYVRGIHTVRGGILLNGGSYRSDDSSNYVGTYVFDSLASFEAGTPRSFTRRVGDPLIDYFNTQAGIYIQDDIRVSKSFSLSPGVRYEVQTHLNDKTAVSPRFGFTWAPFKSGKTSLRASWGIFHDWFSSGTYEQTLRVDGFRQRELIIANPSYPEAGSVGVSPATNRYIVDPDLKMQRTMRMSAGLDQRFTPRFRMSATYAYTHDTQALRGENLNAPVNGVRPDPTFANVIRVLSDGEEREHSLSMNASLQFAAPSPALQAERFNLRRGAVNVNYTVGRVRNNYEGAFSTPATGDLALEWGPGRFDTRQRVNVSLNTQAIKNLSANISVSASTAQPYNITTGIDDNGDLIFNDRPAGVGRNSARGKGQWNVNANFNYNFTFGKRAGRAGAMPPGIMIMSDAGGRVSVSQAAMPQAAGRYRASIFVSVFNLTNHLNPVGYVGSMTSPLFGQPTNVSNARTVNIGINFGF
jgi:hypothetical protein